MSDRSVRGKRDEPHFGMLVLLEMETFGLMHHRAVSTIRDHLGPHGFSAMYIADGFKPRWHDAHLIHCAEREVDLQVEVAMESLGLVRENALETIRKWQAEGLTPDDIWDRLPTPPFFLPN
jgi:hypothetical protein